MSSLYDLYCAMQSADDRFQAALTAAYGRQAGTYRYLPKMLPPELNALRDAYISAVEAWRSAFRTGLGRA
ncbi:hypothetical protein [Labrys wisconsinensis]|uniref:Uncharacterized protein n=1 Tax=Labrys wisconsinensis TaxID=425677 RepID=A0ABU0JLU8_9HYPH|nr:hypothetical protein [Labrys wisconsinensis]MDQ0475257.1 hypothetical protein [Labrys wisconsinensis]